MGTIQNDDAQPAISVNDVSQREGNRGHRPTSPSRSRCSNPSSQTGHASPRQTQDGTATTADSDYAATRAATYLHAGPDHQTVTVAGERRHKFEPDETFSLKLPARHERHDRRRHRRRHDPERRPAAADLGRRRGPRRGQRRPDGPHLHGRRSRTRATRRSRSRSDARTARRRRRTPTTRPISPDAHVHAGPDRARQVTVNANGDTKFEPDEGFCLKLSRRRRTRPSPTTRAPARSRTTTRQPQISVNDVTHAEGNAGPGDLHLHRVAVEPRATRPYRVAPDPGRHRHDRRPRTTSRPSRRRSPSTPGETSARQVTVNVNGDTQVRARRGVHAQAVERHRTPRSPTTRARARSRTTTSQPQISVDDVTHAEGNSGQTDYAFTVSLSNPSAQPVTRRLRHPGRDRHDRRLRLRAGIAATLTFAAGQTIQDRDGEGQRRHHVRAGRELRAQALRRHATRRSPTTPAPARSRTTTPSRRSRSTTSPTPRAIPARPTSPSRCRCRTRAPRRVTVDCATQDGTATTADSDYAALAPATLTFDPGQTSKTVTVKANGDTMFEPDESFTLKLSGADQRHDRRRHRRRHDPERRRRSRTISIDDVSQAEGNSGQTDFAFTASLDEPERRDRDGRLRDPGRHRHHRGLRLRRRRPGRSPSPPGQTQKRSP